MTINNAADNTARDSRPAIITTTAVSRPWRVGAFLLAGAAQLITVSALPSVDPLSPTWAALLAVAPAPLAAAAACTPPPAAKPATVVAAAVLIVGIVGAIARTGLFFAPGSGRARCFFAPGSGRARGGRRQALARADLRATSC
jgi:hypothetical protein